MGTTTELVLNERVHRSMGDWLKVQTTTNIAASNVIVSNTLSQYDGGRDGYFVDRWCYIETMANAGTVRRVKNYYTANTTAELYGINLTANTNVADVWFNRYSFTDVQDSIRDSLRELYPVIHRPIVNTKMLTTYDYFEYTLPAEFADASILQVHIQENSTTTDAEKYWLPIHEWDIIEDGTNRILRLGGVPASNTNMKITAIAPINITVNASDTIPISEERHLALLTAYAKYKFYDKHGGLASSQDRERWERESLKAYAEYKRLLPTGRMISPNVLMKI